MPWRDNQELWMDKARSFLDVGDDLLACAAFVEVLQLRRKDEETGVTMDWGSDAERQTWLQASRCAVRTGTWGFRFCRIQLRLPRYTSLGQ